MKAKGNSKRQLSVDSKSWLPAFLQGKGSPWWCSQSGQGSDQCPSRGPAGFSPQDLMVASPRLHLSELSAGWGRVLINCK